MKNVQIIPADFAVTADFGVGQLFSISLLEIATMSRRELDRLACAVQRSDESPYNGAFIDGWRSVFAFELSELVATGIEVELTNDQFRNKILAHIATNAVFPTN